MTPKEIGGMASYNPSHKQRLPSYLVTFSFRVGLIAGVAVEHMGNSAPVPRREA